MWGEVNTVQILKWCKYLTLKMVGSFAVLLECVKSSEILLKRKLSAELSKDEQTLFDDGGFYSFIKLLLRA